jgi:collagenase-like PrtC family protease
VQANEVQELVDSGVDGLIVPDPFAVRGDEEA